MRQNERREWRKLKDRLFRPAIPSQGAEAFVHAVMARLPEREERGFFGWGGFWFKIPALAFAALLLLMLVPRSEEPVRFTDELLLADKSTEPIGLILKGEEVPPEALVGFSGGEQ